MTNKYVLITVDTEALPNRAETDHVRRLIWGEHANGTAGVREMCAVGTSSAFIMSFLWPCVVHTYGEMKWKK